MNDGEEYKYIDILYVQMTNGCNNELVHWGQCSVSSLIHSLIGRFPHSTTDMHLHLLCSLLSFSVPLFPLEVWQICQLSAAASVPPLPHQPINQSTRDRDFFRRATMRGRERQMRRIFVCIYLGILFTLCIFTFNLALPGHAYTSVYMRIHIQFLIKVKYTFN